MKLLHIDASILGGNSVSRQLSAAAVERLRKTTPDLDVTYHDLSAKPLSHLSGEHLAAAHGATPETQAVRDDIAASTAALDEFLAADIVVIGAPMYNFTIPSQLKAWIDRLLVAGKTFSYSEKGVEGLAGGKRDRHHFTRRLLRRRCAGCGGRTPRNVSALGVWFHRHQQSRVHRRRWDPDQP